MPANNNIIVCTTYKLKYYIDYFQIIVYFRFLSQAAAPQLLAWMFKLGVTTIREIIYDTCDVLHNVLSPVYLAPPNTHEWRKIAEDFELIWNLPNCVSSVDGKHINIECPPNAGSEFYNYKGHHSIVLLAACDANYIFTAVDIGAYGSQSDGGIFALSSFGQLLLKGTLNIPEEKVLPNSNFLCPHFFVGDSAFPLKKHLMRPYPGSNLDEKKENFNYRLSRARRVIENAFGILTARWRILRTTLTMIPINVDKIIKATVVLHNFVKLQDTKYCPPNMVDQNVNGVEVLGLWRQEVKQLPTANLHVSNFSARSAIQMRDQLSEYLFQNRLNRH